MEEHTEAKLSTEKKRFQTDHENETQNPTQQSMQTAKKPDDAWEELIKKWARKRYKPPTPVPITNNKEKTGGEEKLKRVGVLTCVAEGDVVRRSVEVVNKPNTDNYGYGYREKTENDGWTIYVHKFVPSRNNNNWEWEINPLVSIIETITTQGNTVDIEFMDIESDKIYVFKINEENTERIVAEYGSDDHIEAVRGEHGGRIIITYCKDPEGKYVMIMDITKALDIKETAWRNIEWDKITNAPGGNQAQ